MVPSSGTESRRVALVVSRHKGGIGHLSRAIAIAEALAGAGWRTMHYAIGPEAHLRAVEPVESIWPWADSGATPLSLERTRSMLARTAEPMRPSLIVTELYPFASHRLDPILRPLLDDWSRWTTPPRLVCSLRDVPVTDHSEPLTASAARVRETLREYYSEVWYHSDERVCGVRDVAGLEDALRDTPVRVTGYVVRTKRREEVPRFDLLVTGGSGAYAVPLFEALLASADHLPEMLGPVHLAPGPFYPSEARARLTQRPLPASWHVHSGTADLWNLIGGCERVVSMAGPNTIMEAVVRNRPVLVTCRTSSYEQHLRATLMARAGLVRLLDERQAPELAMPEGIEALRDFRPAFAPRCDGAAVCTRLAEALVC